jgi:hypothetical protein
VPWKADSGSRGFAVVGGHGDKFHEVKRDVFVAAGAHRKSGHSMIKLLMESKVSRFPALPR